jgi:hypothetical protein
LPLPLPLPAGRSSSLPVAPVIIAVVVVDPESTVHNLRVLINAALARSRISDSFSRGASLRSANFVGTSITDDCFRSLVAALVHTRFVYGDFILVGLPAYRLRFLQSILNAAAQLTLRLRRYDQVTDALVVLH